MEVFNATPYVFLPFDSSSDPAQSMLTLVVKGTFKLQPGEAAVAVGQKQQQPPRGDDIYMDDIGRSLRYASDLAPTKVRGEVTVNAVCHVTDGRPRAACDVSIELGAIRKRLRVTGNRAWVTEPHVVMTRPLAFERMPMRWERAFGGLSLQVNPLGRGGEAEPDEAGGSIWRLPNVEYLDKLVTRPEDRPPPAGFGPISPMWQPRLKRQGTRDQRWAAFRAPLAPKDFDPLCHNAAPEDQQLPKGYFRGDEALVVAGLHPHLAVYRTALPGKRLRLFLLMARPAEGEAPEGAESEGVPARFVEVQMNLDTVHVDMEAEALVLLWRRQVPSLADPAHPEFEAIYVVEEELAEEPLPREVCFARLVELRNPPEEKAEEKPEEPALSEEEAAAIEEQMGAARKILKDANVDPKVLERVGATKDPEEAFRILMDHAQEKIRELEQMTETLKNAK
jgi:hypothetical protein